MFKEMKFLLFAIILAQAFSLKVKNQSKAHSARDYIIYYGTDYTLSTPIYYTPSIIVDDYHWVRSYVTYPSNVICSIEYGCYYDDGYYYYYDAYYTFTDGAPVYLFRKGNENNKNKENKDVVNVTKNKKVDLEKEMKALKKELYGNENYDTAALRKKEKAFDPRWLAAQLKISRVLTIEDLIVSNKAKMESEKLKDAENKVSATTSTVVANHPKAAATTDATQGNKNHETSGHTNPATTGNGNSSMPDNKENKGNK